LYGILFTPEEEPFLLEFKTERKSLNFNEEQSNLLIILGQSGRSSKEGRGSEAFGSVRMLDL